MDTHLLSIPLTGGQRPPAALASCRVAGRHGAHRIEQVTQGGKPIGGAAGSVQRDLAADAPLKRVVSRSHTP